MEKFNRLPFNGMNSFDIAVANKLDEIISALNELQKENHPS